MAAQLDPLTAMHDAALWSSHVDKESLPWVRRANDIGAMRLLQARPAENFMVLERAFDPNSVSALHRHIGHAFAFTQSGAWGHRHDEHPYLPGTFVYEPSGVVHRFHNSPQIAVVMFVLIGHVETLDDAGRKVVGRASVQDTLAGYLQACEQARLPRPNVLG